ncbi:ACP S-malonyltransferase [Anaerolineales bacterium]
MTATSSIALVFPGQGSQSLGMAKDIADAYPIAADTFSEADSILGYSISDIIFNGPEQDLNDTAITQPAIYIASLAIYRVLASQLTSLNPRFLAGHSLGEFTALTVADAFSFTDGLQLVAERGRLMKEAGEQNPGAMAAILGLEYQPLLEICQAATQEAQAPVVIANDNCPGQIVISGDKAALELAIQLANDAGARKIVPLAVSVATHSPLMASAQLPFSEKVQKIKMNTPTIPIVANVSYQAIHTVEEIQEELHLQLTNAVHWTQTIQFMLAQACDTFIEIGPGDVLTGLIKRIDRNTNRISINKLDTLRNYIDNQA